MTPRDEALAFATRCGLSDSQILGLRRLLDLRHAALPSFRAGYLSFRLARSVSP